MQSKDTFTDGEGGCICLLACGRQFKRQRVSLAKKALQHEVVHSKANTDDTALGSAIVTALMADARVSLDSPQLRGGEKITNHFFR